MGRSEPGGEKERELARMATKGRREGRQANDWRAFNKKRINQAKTGPFIPNLCETEHPGDNEHVLIFTLESRRDLGRLYGMTPARIVVHYQCCVLIGWATSRLYIFLSSCIESMRVDICFLICACSWKNLSLWVVFCFCEQNSSIRGYVANIKTEAYQDLRFSFTWSRVSNTEKGHEACFSKVPKPLGRSSGATIPFMSLLSRGSQPSSSPRNPFGF